MGESVKKTKNSTGKHNNIRIKSKGEGVVHDKKNTESRSNDSKASAFTLKNID